MNSRFAPVGAAVRTELTAGSSGNVVPTVVFGLLSAAAWVVLVGATVMEGWELAGGLYQRFHQPRPE